MTPAKNIELEVYVKIWELLASSDGFKKLVPPASWVRYDTITGDETTQYNTADSDYPRAILFPPESGTCSLFTSEETFETYSDSGPSNWLEKTTLTYRLKLVAQLHSEYEISTLGVEARDAIRRGGPKLGGMSYVTAVTLRWDTSVTEGSESNQDQDAKPRQTTNVFIQLTIENDGVESKGAN